MWILNENDEVIINVCSVKLVLCCNFLSPYMLEKYSDVFRAYHIWYLGRLNALNKDKPRFARHEYWVSWVYFIVLYNFMLESYIIFLKAFLIDCPEFMQYCQYRYLEAPIIFKEFVI